MTGPMASSLTHPVGMKTANMHVQVRFEKWHDEKHQRMNARNGFLSNKNGGRDG